MVLPTAADLRVRVTRCDHVQGESPHLLLFLRAQLASEGGSLGTAAVNTDLEFADALFDYLAERCDLGR